MIELHDVALEIGGHPLLSGLSARIGAHELVAVVGPNGVGKTTLLRALAGLHRTVDGVVRVDGVAIDAMTAFERARRIALVTADDVLLDALAVRDVVAIGRFAHHRWWQWRTREDDDAAVTRALDAVAMSDFGDRLFASLSSGERQRVWIALGLAQETPILLLDEPTSHLDLRVAHEILALLRELASSGKLVVCALHDVNEAAAYADRIALLGNGTMLALEPPEALLNDARLDGVYGIALERIRLPSGSLRIYASDGRRASQVSS
ncbi:MAG: ABC transporter ATP-binding protein [Candidatus Eremiobacteraeota bacterium]|nr:ABC transporter ATP-binding protein [Candidatus Eremiobacteraeota bacterium]